jgi:hypothetical protein
LSHISPHTLNPINPNTTRNPAPFLINHRSAEGQIPLNLTKHRNLSNSGMFQNVPISEKLSKIVAVALRDTIDGVRVILGPRLMRLPSP